MSQSGACDAAAALRWILILFFFETEADPIISIPSTATWTEVNGSCTDWTNTSQSRRDGFKTALSDAFVGIEVSHFSALAFICGVELTVAFQLTISPSASEFDTTADAIVKMLRNYRFDNAAREKLNSVLQSVGYPSTVASINFALWRCDTGCDVLTASTENTVIVWLGRNFTTLPPTTMPPTPEPEKCTFHMMWLFEDLAKDNCGLQAGLIFGGFAFIIICCPLTIGLCLRKRKQIEGLVCSFQPATALSIGAETVDITAGDTKVDEEENMMHVVSSLHQKAYSKQCSQLDEDLHQLMPAYKDCSDVEFYSVKNGCWIEATLHVFAAGAPGDTSNATPLDDASNASPPITLDTNDISNEKRPVDRSVGLSRRRSRLSEESGCSTVNSAGTHRKVYGVELHLGEGHKLQWRYDIQLNQLRLPLNQSELVEVCGRDDMWVEGKVEGPRFSRRKQIGYSAYRQQLGYNVRLSNGLLQKNLPAERIRRCFPVDSEVEYYAGPDLGWLPGMVLPVKDVEATLVKAFVLQPWNSFKQQSRFTKASASNGMMHTKMSFESGGQESTASPRTASPPPEREVTKMDTIMSSGVEEPHDNIVDTRINNSSPTTPPLGNSNRNSRKKNDAWSNAMSLQSGFNMRLKKDTSLASHSSLNTNAPSEDSNSTKGDASMRPPLWTMIAIQKHKDDMRRSKSSDLAGPKSTDTGGKTDAVDLEVAAPTELNGTAKSNGNGHSHAPQPGEAESEISGDGRAEIGSFLVRLRGRRRTSWL